MGPGRKGANWGRAPRALGPGPQGNRNRRNRKWNRTGGTGTDQPVNQTEPNRTMGFLVFLIPRDLLGATPGRHKRHLETTINSTSQTLTNRRKAQYRGEGGASHRGAPTLSLMHLSAACGGVEALVENQRKSMKIMEIPRNLRKPTEDTRKI